MQFFSNREIKYPRNLIPLRYCFANRSSLDKNSGNMDEKFFLKKIEVTRFIGRLFPLTTIERQLKEVGQYKLRVTSIFLLFNDKFRIKISF